MLQNAEPVIDLLITNEKSMPNLLQQMTFRHYRLSVLCDNETVNWYPNRIKFKMHDQRKNCDTDATNQ